jgi:hypothetical protein
MATNGLVPDVTLLLTIPVDRGMARVGARDRGLDRIETVELEFHERVARAFETFATHALAGSHRVVGPIALIDATGSEHDVFALVLASFMRGGPELSPRGKHAISRHVRHSWFLSCALVSGGWFVDADGRQTAGPGLNGGRTLRSGASSACRTLRRHTGRTQRSIA